MPRSASASIVGLGSQPSPDRIGDRSLSLRMIPPAAFPSVVSEYWPARQRPAVDHDCRYHGQPPAADKRRPYGSFRHTRSAPRVRPLALILRCIFSSGSLRLRLPAPVTGRSTGGAPFREVATMPMSPLRRLLATGRGYLRARRFTHEPPPRRCSPPRLRRQLRAFSCSRLQQARRRFSADTRHIRLPMRPPAAY